MAETAGGPGGGAQMVGEVSQHCCFFYRQYLI